MTTLHHGVDFALRLRLVEAVFSDDLGDKIITVLERAEFPLGKFVPLGTDVVEEDFLVFGRIAGLRGGRIQICGIQGISKRLDEASFECTSFKQQSYVVTNKPSQQVACLL